jgi:asparagine synthase (glutamine-hydrolysing)
MCGIAGAIDTANREELVTAVEKMTAAMVHRGPDDGGVSSFKFRVSSSAIDGQQRKGGVVLGSRRLAILDLSPAGHQPMQDEEAGLTIAYNGETYNFRELRNEIGDQFGPWASNTDTEVVLRAYRKWGLEAFAKLRGMFAVAIWDARRQELILARDEFGIKPLYYTISSAFLFASEVRALLASDIVPRKLSLEGVASYLTSGSVEAPLTIVDGVRSLMPGYYLRVSIHNDTLQVEERSYVDNGTADTENILTARLHQSRRETLALLRQKLEQSVRLHLVSDVPLGVFLSGGMDSSAIVALMSQVTKEKPKTFSVIFDEKKFNEAPHSRLIATTFQTDHREIHLNGDQLLNLLPTALSAMDQPTMDAVNTFVVSKAVKEAGVTVALSGLGGDELFAGYPSFRRAQRLEKMSQLSRGLFRSAAAVGKATLSGSVQRNKLWALAQSDGGPVDVHRITRQLFARDQVRMLMAYPSATADGTDNVTSLLADPPATAGGTDSNGTDVINAVSRLELNGYMANTLLRDTDSMSMAHSLEVRVPFVDPEVAHLVLSLPGNWKLNGGRTKPLLADALADLLPAEVIQRSKMGFTLPFEKWMQSRLRPEISSVLGNREHSRKAALDGDAVAGVWQDFLRSPRGVGWSRPWALYVLNKWCEINAVTN